MKRFTHNVGMEDIASRSHLAERRLRLQEAVRILQHEIAALDRELGRSTGRQKAALTEDFFWKSVFPVLLVEREMTSGMLRSRLSSAGVPLDDGRFRTFLSRTRKRGLLEVKGPKTGRPLWKLAERALVEGTRRNREV